MTLKTHRTGIVKSAILTVGMRWADRLIGIASTLILARLLAPNDFGIIAMASLVVGLIDVLLDLGVNVALIQNRDAEQAHYDTAWTLRLLQSLVAAAIIFAFSPLAGDYFDDQRIVSVLRVMSSGLILIGLENIGIVTFQKNMQFGLDFRFMFIKRISAFLATITSAFIMHSYWALVIGTLVGRILGLLLSYQIHPMRPKLSLEKFGDIFGVSQWMLVNSIGNYLDRNLHKTLVGRYAGTTIMGGYSLADEISAMPSGELLAPLNRVLFPAFVEARNNPADLKRLFLLAQGVQTLIGVPIAVGLVVVAHEAVLLFLGDKWSLVVPFIQWLALANVIDAITTSGSYVLITLGQARSVALLGWVRTTLFVTCVFLALPDSGALQIAILRVLTVFSGLALALWLVMRALENLRLGELVANTIRPLIAAAVMAATLYTGLANIDLPLFPMLLIKVMLGTITYPVTVLLLWLINGKPEGTESYLMEKIRNMIGSTKRTT